MKASELKRLISDRFKAGISRPIYIEASPGVGKSEIVEQIANELGVGYKIIHAPLLQPEDYGFPVISADRKNVDFVVSSAKFPLESSDCPAKGIFFIDELPQADASAQKILANVVQAREIHGQFIPEGWLIVAAGNRLTDRAGANRLLTHLKNRFTSVPMEVSPQDWETWALENDIKTEVISFIRFRPDLLNAFDPANEINATPRSWSQGVSPVLGAIEPSLEFASFRGDVGEGPAAEFMAYLQTYRDLPTFESIIMNPADAEVPTKPAILFAVSAMMSSRTTADNFERVMKFVSRLPGEFGVMFMRDVIRRTPEIQTTKTFIKWASKDGAKLLS